MRAQLLMLWENVSTSLWFVPGLLTLAAVLLAWLALAPPVDPSGGGDAAWWLYGGSARDAANLLSSLLTSMITMATLAISITMVVLTLAARQLGPRLIRSFMADRRTQFMLGFFLSTIVYLLLILRTVDGTVGDDEVTNDGVHQLAVSLGTALVLVCVFLLLFFVHHLARSIVADAVIQRVGNDLDAAVRHMMPEADAGAPRLPGARPPRLGGAPLHLTTGGYVQAVSYADMVSCARAAGAVVELAFRPGHHVLPDGEHGRVHPSSALTDEVKEGIAESVVIGSERTPTQDPEFAIRQLVEIALRALSPGVNDPFTAIAVIDRLGVSLAYMMRRGPAVGVWSDDEGQARVFTPTATFRGIVDAAFNQIRQSGEGQPAILIRLLETFAQLAELVRCDEHRQVFADHVAMVVGAGERSIDEAGDLAGIEEGRAAALAALGMV